MPEFSITLYMGTTYDIRNPGIPPQYNQDDPLRFLVTYNGNALRIKTDATATGSTVSNVVYTRNRATGTTGFGVLIDQSYPTVLGMPGTGVVISGITFTGTNTIAVGSTRHRVEVNCGSTSSCIGTWNFAGLTVTGGTGSTMKNAPVTGGSF
ncbi:hypothetical protein C8J57DRAFT_1257207 [Mycena rebaudengoi]|nr:hypothetical protein C8J57DRAFT_1257207 [Mycena rebaudengoi]